MHVRGHVAGLKIVLYTEGCVGLRKCACRACVVHNATLRADRVIVVEWRSGLPCTSYILASDQSDFFREQQRGHFAVPLYLYASWTSRKTLKKSWCRAARYVLCGEREPKEAQPRFQACERVAGETFLRHNTQPSEPYETSRSQVSRHQRHIGNVVTSCALLVQNQTDSYADVLYNILKLEEAARTTLFVHMPWKLVTRTSLRCKHLSVLLIHHSRRSIFFSSYWLNAMSRPSASAITHERVRATWRSWLPYIWASRSAAHFCGVRSLLSTPRHWSYNGVCRRTATTRCYGIINPRFSRAFSSPSRSRKSKNGLVFLSSFKPDKDDKGDQG